MAINDTTKLDFLWKKIIFGMSKTDLGTSKMGSNETISSSTLVLGHEIWSQATTENIPATPPTSSSAVVEVRNGASRAVATMDGTSTANRTWLTGLKDWIQPTFGSGYSVAVYIGDPNVGPAARIFPDTTNEEWVFDYTSGVLHFATGVPANKSATIGNGTVSVATNGIYIVGYRYIGTKGLGGAGVNIKTDQLTYSGANVTSGNAVLTNFFQKTPQAGTIDVMINGVRLENDVWSVSDTTLTLNFDNIPYDLESGDVISAQYGFAG